MNEIPPLVRDVLDRLGLPDADVTTARTMPTEVYTSEEFYDFEKEAIFAKEWLCLGHVSQIPQVGDFFSINCRSWPRPRSRRRWLPNCVRRRYWAAGVDRNIGVRTMNWPRDTRPRSRRCVTSWTA